MMIINIQLLKLYLKDTSKLYPKEYYFAIENEKQSLQTLADIHVILACCLDQHTHSNKIARQQQLSQQARALCCLLQSQEQVGEHKEPPDARLIDGMC